MPIFIDQTGRSAEVIKRPKRIISLVPSQSEFLWDIGLREELIGITKFCIHPYEMFCSVERVGGTKSLHLNKIRDLKPDLIIGNKEENEKSQIEELRKEFPVWMSDIYTLEDSLNMMKEIGKIVGREDEALLVSSQVSDAVRSVTGFFNGEKVLYFIWKGPYMLAATNTFIDHVFSHLGLRNCADHLNRYPEVTIDEIKKMEPDLCFLSTEPYPFKKKHVEELSGLLPGTKVVLVDGELFSWYGSRLRGLPDYLKVLKKEISN